MTSTAASGADGISLFGLDNKCVREEIEKAMLAVG
jgi:hypothetical protein